MSDLEKSSSISKPKAGTGDYLHLATRVGLSALPYGGIAKEFFTYFIAPPLAKRQAEWMESIVNRLTELEKKVEGFKIENLAEDESFVSTIYYATVIAVRSHQVDKLAALQNAVLNKALKIQVEEDLQHIFLNFIDELTPTHLIILKYLESPEQWFKEKQITTPDYYMGGAMTVFYHAFPELKDKQVFVKTIIDDLSNRGLSNDWQTFQVMVSKSSMFGPKVTPLGRQFLAFINNPQVLREKDQN